MTRIIDLSHAAARDYFLKGTSYFNGDFPKYISFEIILERVAETLSGETFHGRKKNNPSDIMGVNYSFTTNKDGRFAWRPYELVHPAIFVSLVNVMTSEENWQIICSRLQSFYSGVVDCCSVPAESTDQNSDQAAQIRTWWKEVEQKSIRYSLEYSHCLNTDVVNCYGSIYTHSIAWALHTKEVAKKDRRPMSLLGNMIDHHLSQSRYGQTNGIPQGSALMDFIAEIVLGYVDQSITERFPEGGDFKIIRYRDDYRIFANSDQQAEKILKTISDSLREVGMRLGGAKTNIGKNVIESSIKPDKIAGISLQDLGTENAKTIQKQLLRLHTFGLQYPNSGALRRLLSEIHREISSNNKISDDIVEQIAIVSDIALVSPSTFPAAAGILSHLISLLQPDEKVSIWNRIHCKMQRVPHNGYLDIWLQRVTKPRDIGIELNSHEAICQIVNGKDVQLWNNDWISSQDLIGALDVKKIIVEDPVDIEEKIEPKEVEMFTQMAWMY